MSEQLQRVLAWLAASVAALVMTLQMTSASYVDGHWLPVGHDAFYHGRRILDAVATGHLYQFDPLMHVPQGDWVTWPWAYDAVLAWLTRLVMALTGAVDADAVLMHLPPVMAVAGVALIVAIATEMRLTLGLTFLAAMCFACNAFTQYQFGVGALDHHGAEQLATLGALWLGLRWFNRPDDTLRAGMLGAALGLALGVHAGLFILQLPLLGALLWRWWRGEQLSARAATAFCVALVLGALVVLVPAATFWQPLFVIYYLSSLHLYVCVCTCIVVSLLARCPADVRHAAQLGALSAALAIPLIATVVFSSDFLVGKLTATTDIDEIHSPYSIARDAAAGGVRRIMLVYTHLIWIAPLTLMLCAYKFVSARALHSTYFWACSGFGIALLMAQMRLGSYGAAFTYLPWLVWVHEWQLARPQRAVALSSIVTLALLVAYYPTLRYQLFGGKVLAMDQQYASLRPVLPTLERACAEDPGVVLAEPGEGHLVRYFTRCSVISNNFRLTPLDVQKVGESLGLIAEPLTAVRRQAPDVKYVIARLIPPNESANPVLFHELLGAPASLPDVEKLVELTVTHPDGKAEKFLGVYKVRP